MVINTCAMSLCLKACLSFCHRSPPQGNGITAGTQALRHNQNNIDYHLPISSLARISNLTFISVVWINVFMIFCTPRRHIICVRLVSLGAAHIDKRTKMASWPRRFMASDQLVKRRAVSVTDAFLNEDQLIWQTPFFAFILQSHEALANWLYWVD